MPIAPLVMRRLCREDRSDAGGGNSAEYAQQLMGITKKTYIINLPKSPPLIDPPG